MLKVCNDCNARLLFFLVYDLALAIAKTKLMYAFSKKKVCSSFKENASKLKTTHNTKCCRE